MEMEYFNTNFKVPSFYYEVYSMKLKLKYISLIQYCAFSIFYTNLIFRHVLFLRLPLIAKEARGEP